MVINQHININKSGNIKLMTTGMDLETMSKPVIAVRYKGLGPKSTLVDVMTEDGYWSLYSVNGVKSRRLEARAINPHISTQTIKLA